MPSTQHSPTVKRSAIKGHRPTRHPSSSITPPSKAPPSEAPSKQSAIKATLHHQAKRCAIKGAPAPAAKQISIQAKRHQSNSAPPSEALRHQGCSCSCRQTNLHPSKAPPSTNGTPIKQSTPRVRATELLWALASNSDKVLFNGYTFRPTKRACVRQFLIPARSARWGCRSVCHSASQA